MFKDMQQGRFPEMLKPYIVSYSFKIPTGESAQLVELLLSKFLMQAAEDLKMQKGREYGFGGNNDVRGTQLFNLTAEELEGLPTHNVYSERRLAVMDKLTTHHCRSVSSNFRGLGERVGNAIERIKCVKTLTYVLGLEDDMVVVGAPDVPLQQILEAKKHVATMDKRQAD